MLVDWEAFGSLIKNRWTCDVDMIFLTPRKSQDIKKTKKLRIPILTSSGHLVCLVQWGQFVTEYQVSSGSCRLTSYSNRPRDLSDRTDVWLELLVVYLYENLWIWKLSARPCTLEAHSPQMLSLLGYFANLIGISKSHRAREQDSLTKAPRNQNIDRNPDPYSNQFDFVTQLTRQASLLPSAASWLTSFAPR